MSGEVKLLPCPFCGGHALAAETLAGGHAFYGVDCHGCGAQVHGSDPQEATKLWNRRHRLASLADAPASKGVTDALIADIAKLHDQDGSASCDMCGAPLFDFDDTDTDEDETVALCAGHVRDGAPIYSYRLPPARCDRPAISEQAGEGERVDRVTPLMVDAALDTEWFTDAGGDAPASGPEMSIREVMEDAGLSTREAENAMFCAITAALDPPGGNPWEITYDRDGPR